MKRALLVLGVLLFGLPRAQAQGLDPTIRPDALEQLTEHVYVIPDQKRPLVPNVGLIVGEKATLVIDPGLGEANGQIVYEAARSLTGATRFYVSATHTHPEHDLGAMGFPDDALVVRSMRQELDIATLGMDLANRFATFSDLTAQALEGAYVRDSDIVFLDSLRLNLGGVHVRLFAVGPAHTGGDLAFYVEEDNVLFTGDVAMDQFPMPLAANGTVATWLRALDRFEALDPAIVVPCHYAVGDVSIVRAYRDYFAAVRTQVQAMRAEGVTNEALTRAVTETVAPKFAAWTDPGRIGATVRLVLRDLAP